MNIHKIIKAAIMSVAIFLIIPLSALAAPQTMPDGGIFDAEYYAKNNPDVAATIGYDSNALYAHYLNFGSKEGRLPYDPAYNVNLATNVMIDNFDSAYYAAAYPEIAAVYGTDPQSLYSHYINYGKYEGRFPNVAAQQAKLVADRAAAEKAVADNAKLAAQQTSSQQKTVSKPGRTVYWTEKGKSYHSTQSCRTLSRSKVIYSGSIDECPKNDPCDVCN